MAKYIYSVLASKAWLNEHQHQVNYTPEKIDLFRRITQRIKNVLELSLLSLGTLGTLKYGAGENLEQLTQGMERTVKEATNQVGFTGENHHFIKTIPPNHIATTVPYKEGDKTSIPIRPHSDIIELEKKRMEEGFPTSHEHIYVVTSTPPYMAKTDGIDAGVYFYTEDAAKDYLQIETALEHTQIDFKKMQHDLDEIDKNIKKMFAAELPSASATAEKKAGAEESKPMAEPEAEIRLKR